MISKEETVSVIPGLRSMRKTILLILGAFIICNILAFLHTVSSTSLSTPVGPAEHHADILRPERKLTQQQTVQLLPSSEQALPAATQHTATATDNQERALEPATSLLTQQSVPSLQPPYLPLMHVPDRSQQPPLQQSKPPPPLPFTLQINTQIPNLTTSLAVTPVSNVPMPNPSGLQDVKSMPNAQTSNPDTSLGAKPVSVPVLHYIDVRDSRPVTINFNNLHALAQPQVRPRPPPPPPRPPPKPMPDPAIAAKQTDWPIWWFAPFFDRTSFGKEAATMVLGMMRSGAVPENDIWIGTTQGNCRYGVDKAMPADDFKQLDAANHRWNMSMSAIAICHSLPPFWARPKNKWQTCMPCPPVGYTPAITIGRAMAETDIFHHEFVKYCNRMDEVWVPSDFSRDVLMRSGVPAEKLRVVPIPVNTTLFDPDRVTAIQLPIGQLAFGINRYAPPPQEQPKEQAKPLHQVRLEQQNDVLVNLDDTKYRAHAWANLLIQHVQTRPLNQMDDSLHFVAQLPGVNVQPTAEPVQQRGIGEPALVVKAQTVDAVPQIQPVAVSSQQRGIGEPVAVSNSQTVGIHQRQLKEEQASKPKPFVLFSCFKWAMRKGWDVLLSAYLQEFTSDDNVELYILTKPFMNGGNFIGDMRNWAKKNLGISDWSKMPTLYVISHHLTAEQYAGVLKASDAFVIATRGEGWGMPISEAMSMGLPVVVTNWSGVTAFVDETVGYMVDYNMSKVPDEAFWWFRGASWAAPSVPSLRHRLREVMTDREQAAHKGRLARQRMIEKFSPEAVGFMLADEFKRLKTMLRSGHCGDKCHNKTWVAAPGDIRPEYYTGRESFIRNIPQVRIRPTVNRVVVGQAVNHNHKP